MLDKTMKKELPPYVCGLEDTQIRAIALDCGFELRQQLDGTEDLNPYVYKFAEKILSTMPSPEEVARYRNALLEAELGLCHAVSVPKEILEEIASLKAEVTRLRVAADSAEGFLFAVSMMPQLGPAVREVALKHHEDLRGAIEGDEIMSNETAVKVQMILYTDTVDGEQVCRDDLWAVSASELAKHGLLPAPTELNLGADNNDYSHGEDHQAASAVMDEIWKRMVKDDKAMLAAAPTPPAPAPGDEPIGYINRIEFDRQLDNDPINVVELNEVGEALPDGVLVYAAAPQGDELRKAVKTFLSIADEGVVNRRFAEALIDLRAELEKLS